MHMEPVVGQNVFIIQIVPVEWPVFVNIVEIHVQAYVVKIPNVKLSIMCQFVHAFEITKAIHLLDADQYQKYVSILEEKKNLFLKLKFVFI